MKQKVLINLSNHPVDKWGEMQRKNAESFASVFLDIPFPHVPPEADKSFIQNLADEILYKIIEYDVAVIHVMGEHTLNHALVERFKKSGYRTIASTTHRVSEVLQDGSKISKFEFVRFRDY